MKNQKTMRKSKGSPVQAPVPKGSRLSPSPSRIPKKIAAGNVARSAEDIPRRVQLSCSTELTPLRSMSPGSAQGSKMGVRYITGDLIKKTAKQENLALIITLNLTLSNDIGKKIKYIENLEALKQLQVLNLSGNCIEKIEKLEKLTQLQELNLSFNNIRKMEGMESLVGLQVLNLTGNQIEHIPSWLGKRLKSLRVFKIAKNNLQSLNELSRLKTLPDIVQLSLADNPLSELPHSRAYVIFHIRTLEILDGQPINAMDRSKAKERFSMEEIINLEKALDSQETKNQKLEEAQCKFIKEHKQIESDCQNMKKKDQETSSRIKELEQELQTKNDLLKKKTKELHRACEKHYQLEQELAFYKIDAKFANLGEEPVADQTLDTDDNEPLIESPYIGKALYKPNQFAKEVQNSAKAQKAKLTSQPQNDDLANVQNIILQQKKEQAELDELLQEKQQEIESANKSLKKVQESLIETESKVKQAHEEFKRVSSLIPRQSPANEMKMAMRQTLADKMKYVNVLRNQAGVLEKEIDKAEKSVEENRGEMTNLKWQMQQLDSTDPTYREIYGEMVEKEQQIYEDNEVSQRLQEQLGDIVENIATETANIGDLEEQLQQDVQPASPETEELRQELGGVVTGLQTYLENVKDKNHKQMKHIEQLLSEREKLQDKVSDLTELLNNVNQDDQLIQKLKKHVAKTEDALLEQQEFSGQLEKELELKEEEEKDLQEQLKEAFLNIDDLKQELDDSERRAQAEIQSLEQQLIAEKENTLMSTKKAFIEAEKDRHFSRISAELEKAKLMNTALKNELEENRKKFDRCINDYILPGDLKKRMKNLSHSLKTGKSPIEPEDNRDFVGHIFQDLQKGLQDRMNRMKKEIDAGRQNEKKLIQENQTLTNKLDAAMKAIEQTKKDNNNQKDMADAQLANDKVRKLLEEEVKQLKKAFEETKAQLKMEKQKAFEKRVVYAPSESSEHDTMNSEERHLFDELQGELIDFKTKMKDKEDFLNQQLADADAKVAHWQTEAKKQQQFYQQEMQKQLAENASHRNEQDNRSKLISEELNNARAMVNHLQGLLNQRQQQLMSDGDQANMTDQMIASQEEELGHLYNILDTQRQEIEDLNNALDQLMHQNPEAMGPAYDNQLKHLQDKVGRLTKEIATQSSVVKGLPVSMGTNFSPTADVEGSQFNPGILGTHHGPVISAGPLANPASSMLPANDRIHATSMQEFGNVIAPADRPGRFPTNPNLRTGGHSTSMNAGHPSSVNLSSQHPGAPNQYISPSTAQLFRPSSHSAELIPGLTTQPPPVPSYFGNITEQPRPPGSVMVQPVSTLSLPEHSATPAQSFHPSSALFQPGIGGTANQVGTEPFHGPLTYHTSKVSEISPSMGGVSVAPPSQGVSNYSTNPITGTYTLPNNNVGTSGPTFQKLISTPSQIQPSRNISSIMGGQELVQPGVGFGHQTAGGQPISYRVPGSSQLIETPMPSNVQQGSLADNMTHQPVFITESGTRQFNPNSTIPQVHQSEVRGFQPIIDTSSAPIQSQSFSGASLGGQMLQRPSLSQAAQSAPYEPLSSGHTMGQGFQGPVLSPASPYRKSVAFQQPLVSYGPPAHHYPTNNADMVPQSTFNPDSSVNIIPNPKSSQTYSPQVLRKNKQPPGYRQIIPGTQGFSDQQYAPTGHQVNHPESVGPDYPVVPGSPVASSSPIDSPSSPVWSRRSHIGEQFSPIKAGYLQQPTSKRRTTNENLVEDEGRLFCNVPEHHHLEDYVTSLQDKIGWLKMKLKNLKQNKEVVTLNKGRKLICRLQDELEERRSELEGLDLAIERQKKNLKKMKIEESQLEKERKIAKDELQYLKECNNRRVKRKYPFEQSFERQDFDDQSDSSFDEHASFCHQLRLQGEIKCLEKTLLKRQTQLKQVDQELKECKQDLKSAKLQVDDAVRKHDDVTHGLENTAQETVELERRANEVGVHVVTEAERLKLIQAEYREMQKKKGRLEKVLHEINEVISQKDAEFRDVSSKMKTLNLSYVHLQKDLAQMSNKERETTKSLLSSEELLLKKKAQINQLREQSEILGLHTERADTQLKERQAELMGVQQTLDQKKMELSALLKDVQSELNLKQRELKLHQEEVIKLEGQKLELVGAIHNRKGELLQLAGEVERNQNVLSGLNMDTSKQREALNQITEQYKTSQSELSVLKMQLEKKIEALENTSSHLQKVKSELDSISLETRHRKEELELLMQSVMKEQKQINHLSIERSALETQVQHLSDERNLLTDSNKKLDNQLNAMKRELSQIEDKIRDSRKSVDVLQDELQSKQKNIENCQKTKTQLEKDLQNIKESLKDEQEEFSSLQTLIQKTESESNKLKQELQQIHSEKGEAQMILEQLTTKIGKSQVQQQNECRQLEVYQEKLKELLCALEEKNSEMETVSEHTCTAAQELESLHAELNDTKEQVHNLTNQVEPLQKSSLELQEIQREKKETEVEVKLLKEQKSSMEAHLDQLKKNISELYKEPLLDKEKLMNLILNNKQDWKKEALKEKYLEEQDHLRLKLQQQMYRHVDVIEATRQQSEGFLHNLRHKLNVLQDVFITNNIGSPGTNSTNVNNEKSENLDPALINNQKEKGLLSIEEMVPVKENL